MKEHPVYTNDVVDYWYYHDDQPYEVSGYKNPKYEKENQ